MKKVLVALLVFGALGALVVFAGTALLEKAIVAGVESYGSEWTQTPVELEAAELDLLGGAGELRGLAVGNPEGFRSDYSIRAKTMDLELRRGSLLGGKIVVERLVVAGPEILYEARAGGTNLGRILENLDSFAASLEGEAAAEGRKYEVRLLRLAEVRALLVGSGEPVVALLPTIELENLGTGAEGVTLRAVARAALEAIDEAVGAAAAQLERAADG